MERVTPHGRCCCWWCCSCSTQNKLKQTVVPIGVKFSFITLPLFVPNYTWDKASIFQQKHHPDDAAAFTELAFSPLTLCSHDSALFVMFPLACILLDIGLLFPMRAKTPIKPFGEVVRKRLIFLQLSTKQQMTTSSASIWQYVSHLPYDLWNDLFLLIFLQKRKFCIEVTCCTFAIMVRYAWTLLLPLLESCTLCVNG